MIQVSKLDKNEVEAQHSGDTTAQKDLANKTDSLASSNRLGYDLVIDTIKQAEQILTNQSLANMKNRFVAANGETASSELLVNTSNYN